MKTFSALGRALLFWLGALEWLAGRQGWWGLSWLGRGSQRTLVGALLAAPLGMPAGRWRRALSFVLAAPFALALQVGASSLRNRRADPRSGLRPGAHPGRQVEHLHIAMEQGFLPGIVAAPEEGTIAAVCILHGSGDHKGAYTWWMVDALLAENIAVLLVDLDGHGENPRTQQFPAILEDVSAATDYLRERYRRVGVLGISLGGCIAARAVADGTPVDALVLMEAPPLLHFTRADMRREALALAHWPAMQVFRNTSVHQIADTWSTAPIRAAISTWDLIAALDLLGSVKRIQAPLFLLYGGRDAIVKPAQAAEVQAAAPPHATFWTVPGASHLTLFLRRDVQERIARWFASQLHS